MEFVLLAMLAILILKFVKDRYHPGVFATHIIFFVVLLYLSLFTTDVPFIADGVKNFFGEEDYNFFREAICAPCVWIYSTHFAVYVVELLLLFLVHIGTVVEVVKFIKSTGEKEYRRKTKPCFDWASVPERCTRTGEKLFLANCSLLI